ncbi:MAG: general secretion pathway protein GspK, partial [Sedimentisphaerales bacterium]|nr:general secretion pathway protein GspK [Sedimentisphaerales bacterium]
MRRTKIMNGPRNIAPATPRRNGRSSGLALVAVLWAVVLLTALVSVIAKTCRLETRAALADADHVACRWACRAGIETAIGLLNEDERASDCLTDLWSDNPTDCENVQIGNCVFTIRVVDEAGKLNINTATKEQLLELPNMTEEVVDAIMDWRDQDSNLSRTGAEVGYYRNLEIPYEIRNGPLRTIREMLLIKGVSAEWFYGEDTNLNGRLDFNEKDGEKRWPLDNEDDILNEGWISYLTCTSYDTNTDALGDKRININEADENTLVQSLGLSKGQAKWIVQNRNYNSIADLINNNSARQPPRNPSRETDDPDPVPIDLETFAQISDRITVKGDERIEGLINVNTATLTVLTALTEGDETLAEHIRSYRDGQSTGLESIGELALAENIPVS